MADTATTSAPAVASPSKAAPILQLTSAAVAQVKEVMAQQGFEGYVLTVRVVPSGCSGLGYDLNLVKESKAGDTVWTQDGVTLATDELSTQYLAGTEVDFVRSDTASGFKFNNPNARSTCGCGNSFSS